MQDGSNSKQLIAEKIKQSANILITVNSSPSVDALTAALGLTLMLNKLDKHATAVFSGVIPPAISFLEPSKTFENNVDSLRDFIIALDKDKADRLRYKVEDDVVRIFITPYRTKISQNDLQFSQGDFNVDLIVALGVEDQKELDQAITAHGRILHDATVVTINAAAQKSSLGSIDWQDRNASSLSEMLAGIAEMLKPGILDQQISTALLTGIVANTGRFSNQHTTPHVMTIAAQLMAAGANQQLIATKLQSIPAPVSPRREKPKETAPEASKKVNAAPTPDDGEMHINHDEAKQQPAPLPLESAEQPVPEDQPEPTQEPEAELELPIAPPAAQNFDDLKEAIKQETPKVSPPRKQEAIEEPPTGDHNINAAESNDEQQPDSEEASYLTSHPSWQGREINPPTMGGTLSATAEQALEDKMRDESEDKQNRTILTHGGNAQAQGQPQQQSSSSRKRKRNKQSQQNQPKQQPSPPPAPVPKAPEPAPAPAPTPEVASEPEPTPVPEPAPIEPPQPPVVEPAAPVAEPVESAPQSVPEPQQPIAPPEIPVAPPPLVVSEPLTPSPVESAPQVAPEIPEAPAPQPEPTPAPELQAPAHEPTLEELEREAARHAAQAVAPQTLHDLETERQQTIPPPPAPSPQGAVPPIMPQPLNQPAAPAPQDGISPIGLPPLPPMPDFSTLPPVPGEIPTLPPPPSQQPAVPQPPQELAPPPAQPQTPPATPPPAPADPAQFRIPGQQ